MSALYPFALAAGGAYLLTKKNAATSPSTVASTPVIGLTLKPNVPAVIPQAPVATTIAPISHKTNPTLTVAAAIAEAMRIEGNDIDSRDVWFVSGPATYTNILNMVPSYVTPAQAQLIGRDPLSSVKVVPSQGLGKMSLVTTTAGLALGVTSLIAGHAVAAAAAAGTTTAATAVSAAIPFIGVGIAGIVGIYSIIHAHHQAAVQKEQSFYYTANPAAFDYMRVIRGAVASGNASPSEAIHALDSLLADYKAQAAPSLKHNPCNANCEGVFRMTAITIYWKSYYTDMISQGATQ